MDAGIGDSHRQIRKSVPAHAMFQPEKLEGHVETEAGPFEELGTVPQITVIDRLTLRLLTSVNSRNRTLRNLY